MQEGDKEIMAKYYNKEGKELTLFEWVEKFDVDYKRIADDLTEINKWINNNIKDKKKTRSKE